MNLEHSDVEGLLAAVAAVDFGSAIQGFLPMITSPHKRSKMMGQALVAAAVNDQLQTSSLLYKLLSDRETNACQIWKRIDACMGLSQADLVLHLFEWLFVTRIISLP